MEGTKLLADNRKARFNYEIKETLECGISLMGSEVKSMKDGKFSFSDSYARIKNNQLYLVGFHISEYPFSYIEKHEPLRERVLLVHRDQIKRLQRQTEEKGMTLVPLKVYLKKGLIKIEIGIGMGKKMHDKRQTIKDRDENRNLQRNFRQKI